MLWTKDDHLGHLLQALLQEKHFCFYAFRKNNIWQKVFRTILLHMSFAFSWSGPDCRPYFCGKAVKGQEEGATLIVAQRLNWTSWSSLTFHLHQIYSNMYSNIFFYLSLLKNSFIDHSVSGGSNIFPDAQCCYVLLLTIKCETIPTP